MKKLIFILVIIDIFLSLSIVACNNEEEPVLNKETYSIAYICAEGGTIEGSVNQTVSEGDSAISVTAIPNEGYRFVRWSDDIFTAQRTDENITEDLTVTAYFQKLSFCITYSADTGGAIEGKSIQYILYGESTQEVVAMPHENYKFIGWDDGFNDANRLDENILESKTYTALFEQTGTIFNLVYNNATENTDISSVLIYFDSVNTAAFPIPQRINSTFEGWYLDKDFTTQVTDKNGNLLNDNFVYNYDTENLYAKFSIVEDVTYKILMVYVTAVEGTFETYYGDFISINYKMSDLEKHLCETITEKFAQTLNEMFAGLVRFDVDSYFTTEVVHAESFDTMTSQSHGHFDYSLYADKIPELNNFELLDNYRSVLTTVPLDMYKHDGTNPPHKLHSATGVSGSKYACVYWECTVGEYIIGDKPIQRLLDPTMLYYDSAWKFIIAVYAHEFCHTVELQLPKRVLLYDFHKTLEFYFSGVYPVSAQLDVIKLFLLNKAQDNEGVKFGIPYDFWGDSIKFNITFIAGENGTISGKLNQTIAIGGKTETVTAIPDFGYRFVKWSTGHTDPELTYRQIYRDNTITAIFEEMTLTVNYIFVIDNQWVGAYGDNLHYKDFLTTPLYIPEIDGYEFEGWFLDQEYALPIGDKYGKVTEDDYKIFDKEQFGNSVILYGKFSKKE